MQQLEEKIKYMKTKIEEAKDLRRRAELKLENLEKQERDILMELEQLGVKPDQLTEEINRLEQEVREGLQEVEQLLPKELLVDGDE